MHSKDAYGTIVNAEDPLPIPAEMYSKNQVVFGNRAAPSGMLAPRVSGSALRG
ncbi:MAG: hypothetical protein AAGB10_09145 [Pseudomonadota bacterium]